ncbi:hypothetical protein M2138_000270 [Dysgonomonadaceae bacterium PH5-43]|nr:hypothetical protein [Dysgonomonadaceae bacterium PH5-43]
MSSWGEILFFNSKYRKLIDSEYTCYVQEDDFDMFLSSVRKGEFHLFDETLATVEAVRPLIDEYAKGFQDGADNFDKIIREENIFQDDNAIEERIWNITNQPPQSYCINTWESHSDSPKRYLSMPLMYEQGKNGGVHYKAIQTIKTNATRFRRYMDKEDEQSNQYAEFLFENGADCYLDLLDCSEEEKDAIRQNNERKIANYLIKHPQERPLIPEKGKKEKEIKDFRDYLHHNNKEALMEKLHELVDGQKGKDVAITIKALERLNYIDILTNRKAFYESMEKEFGYIGTEQSINPTYIVLKDGHILWDNVVKRIIILGRIK